MKVGNLLLGRSLQFDIKSNHERYSNKYSFSHYSQEINLVSLNHSEAREYQKKMREKMIKKENKKREWKRKRKRKKEMNDKTQEW